MLFKAPILDKIAQGYVTLAFRRWNRPTVKTGGRLRTAAGELAIDAVDAIAPDAITAADAESAGFSDVAGVLAEVMQREDGQLYRIAFHLAGPDRRAALAGQNDLSAGEMAALAQRLSGFDARSAQPWTLQVLGLIGAEEGHPAAALAKEAGMERLLFKQRVRKLKELGLTISLQTGYRLSPRGRAVLDALGFNAGNTARSSPKRSS